MRAAHGDGLGLTGWGCIVFAYLLALHTVLDLIAANGRGAL